MGEQLSNNNIRGIIKKIADQTAELFSGDEAKRVRSFVENFYVNPSFKNLTTLSAEELAASLKDLWNFVKKRKDGEAKFRVFYWKPNLGTALRDRIIVEIVSENHSFILDSLLSLVSQLDMKARINLHPIFQIKRDKKGEILTIQGPSNLKQQDGLESVIHCEITENITLEKVDQLKQLIPQMLEEVKFANQDWYAMRRKTLELTESIIGKSGNPKQDAYIHEVIEFLRWMEGHHFTFLGYAKYTLSKQKDRLATVDETESPLGILRIKDVSKIRILFDGVSINEDARKFLRGKKFPLLVVKTSRVSMVHRGVPMDCVALREFDTQGNTVALHVFLGLFTSVAYDSSARDIPMLRSKVAEVVHRAGFTYDWHDGKALIHILDSLPRDELFQASVENLVEIGLAILRLQERRQLAFFMRRDEFNRFLSCLIYIPREKFDSNLCQRLGALLERELVGTSNAYKAQFGSLPFARVHYIITTKATMLDGYDTKRIEAALIEEARGWPDRLRESLAENYLELESVKLYKRFKSAFEVGYQERYKGDDSLADIHEINKLSKESSFRARLFDFDDQSSDTMRLKIYSYGESLPLSDILPILENLDLRVISEVPYKVSLQDNPDPVWLHDFTLKSKNERMINVANVSECFEKTLVEVYSKKVENDLFNTLVLRAGLSARECIIFRAYAKYLRLIDSPFSKDYIASCLSSNPILTRLLMQFFEARFHPESNCSQEEIINAIEQELDKVTSIDEDRILRAYYSVILNTLRTSFYLRDAHGMPLDFTSFKLSSSLIDILPKPRPLYEIFIYASDMEAVHLRGGRVARGGIRWSDRREDFRREVLGLVKAQMVKNTVIVPTGSKGGFVVKKNLEGLSRQEAHDEVVYCYKKMIRGLLILTDNVVGGKVVHPAGLKIHDGEDPYLVVAADKGTATFSDYANELSKSFGFWLDDAFASGGSEGYDHKKMGITAKGAWESVKRHFRELGKNIQTKEFDVVGIGDMSGDVFGNGMLLSKHIRLKAAFNHIHIFIDPNPDTKTSFEERKRLFKMPRSSWTDYDKSLISKGGGVFDRSAKSLTVSAEIQKMLNLGAAIIRPDDLIKAILRARTELLWFGGIGTYVKSFRESDADVGDRANDAVRVDARDLRAKVIGEGANLGCTQLGRIEFELLSGGKINTDAIDNSAGVATSDLEVNIKILINDLIKAGKLKSKDRSKLLASMTKDVADHVLRDNYTQPQ